MNGGNGGHIFLSLQRGGFGEVRMAEDGNNGGWERGSPEVGTAEERNSTLQADSASGALHPDPLTSTGKEDALAGRRRELCISKVLQHLQTVSLQG